MIFEYSQKELDYLSARDEKMAALIERFGFIERVCERGLFAAVVRNIIAQQISGKAYESILARVKNLTGTISVKNILKCVPADLRACGLSERKVEYIFSFAKKVSSGEFDLAAVKKMSDREAIDALSSLNGIGEWTAEMLLLFCLRRPNILSFGDFSIRLALEKIYGHEKISKKMFEVYRERFSPYGSVASFYLWASNAPEIHFCYYNSPAGTLTLVEQNNALIALKFAKAKIQGGVLCENAFLKNVSNWLKLYFAGTQKLPPLPRVKLTGTPFECEVWDELKKLKYGETTTYGAIAKIIAKRRGNAKMSAQAVGNAVGKNQIPIIVPCHRVLGANKKITGFSDGLSIKRILLNIEKIDFVE